MKKTSNLYSIQLRPFALDIQSHVVNPIFNMNRTIDEQGVPKSLLFNALYANLPAIKIAQPDPRALLIQAVLTALPETPSFDDVQKVLSEQCKALFRIDVNFNYYFLRDRGREEAKAIRIGIDKDYIDANMGFDATASPENYIDALLGYCASDLWTTLSTPLFYSVPNTTERTEHLSIMTHDLVKQFVTTQLSHFF